MSSFMPVLKDLTKGTLPVLSFFFFNDTAPTEIYTLSLHDALPISVRRPTLRAAAHPGRSGDRRHGDRTSTRLNSSHDQSSYAVFCLKKKKHTNVWLRPRDCSSSRTSSSGA